MTNKEFEFKIRKWSDSNPKPFDVVLLDYLKNNQHHQPNAVFENKEQAEQHMFQLQISVRNNTSGVDFIRDTWPIDCVIE